MKEQNAKLKLNSKNGGITFALFMAGYVVVALLGQLIFGAIFGEGTALYRLLCSTLSSLTILSVILFYICYGKHNVSELTSTKRLGGLYFPVALLLACGMMLGLGLTNQAIAKLFQAWGLNSSGIELEMPSVWHFIGYSVTFALLPAVFEEALFRGVLLTCFSGTKRITAVLITALAFAFYHQSFVQFLYQFIYGVALGYLALVAKSILPCIIAHFLNNFTVILLTYLNVALDLYDPLIIVIGANALAFFGTIIFFAQRKLDKTQRVSGEVKSFFLPFGLFAIVICIAVAVGNLVG